MLRITIILLGLLITTEVFADKFIAPPKRIVKIAKMLEYSDFPNYLDILAVARVESAYKQFAKNPEKGIASIGVMQVRGGVYNLDTNMTMGTGLLRQYYKRLGTSEAAIKSYNIGPKNYTSGKLKISAEEYYSKFVKRRKELVKYFAEQQ